MDDTIKNKLFQDVQMHGGANQIFKTPNAHIKRTFIDDEEFRSYVIKTIVKKSPLSRQKLLQLIYNWGKKVSELDDLNIIGQCEFEVRRAPKMGEIVSDYSTLTETIRGQIYTTGDGLKSGSPIMYNFLVDDTEEFTKLKAAKAFGF